MEEIKAFEMLWKALDNEEIRDFSYKSETGIFNIEVEIRHKDFKDYDSEFEVIELEAEEILNNKLDEEIKTLVDDYYKRCKAAYEEEYGVEQPLLKHYYVDGQLCTDYL